MTSNIQMKDTTDGVVVKADGRTLLAKLVFAPRLGWPSATWGLMNYAPPSSTLMVTRRRRCESGVLKPR